MAMGRTYANRIIDTRFLEYNDPMKWTIQRVPTIQQWQYWANIYLIQDGYPELALPID